MLIYELMEESVSRGDFVVVFIIEISPGVKILLLSIMFKALSGCPANSGPVNFGSEKS